MARGTPKSSSRHPFLDGIPWHWHKSSSYIPIEMETPTWWKTIQNLKGQGFRSAEKMLIWPGRFSPSHHVRVAIQSPRYSSGTNLIWVDKINDVNWRATAHEAIATAPCLRIAVGGHPRSEIYQGATDETAKMVAVPARSGWIWLPDGPGIKWR